MKEAPVSLESAVRLEDVSFSYGHLKVISQVSLAIPTGISFGLLGANGAGKTTLIRLMVGLLKPDKGEVYRFGEKPSPTNARLTGYMPQLPSLYAELTVRQNVDFFADIYGLKDRRQRASRVDEAIKVVELWPKRNTSVSDLSGGMKQRASLACAIVHCPRLLFLDEPTAGLDPDVRIRFWNYFDNLTRTGTTIVVSSHTMDDASRCQELAFLREGSMMAQGSPAELKEATGQADATLEDAFLYFVRRKGVETRVQ